MRSVDTFGSNSLKILRHFKNTFSRKLSLERNLPLLFSITYLGIFSKISVFCENLFLSVGKMCCVLCLLVLFIIIIILLLDFYCCDSFNLAVIEST